MAPLVRMVERIAAVLIATLIVACTRTAATPPPKPIVFPGARGSLVVEVRRRSDSAMVVGRAVTLERAPAVFEAARSGTVDEIHPYLFDRVPAGRYELVAYAIGYVGARDSVSIREGRTDTVRVYLGNYGCDIGCGEATERRPWWKIWPNGGGE